MGSFILKIMGKRLQVIIDEGELREIKLIARKNRMTVSEWVRQALRADRQRERRMVPRRKLEVVRAAAQHSFPSGEIGQMLDEIERGYREGMSR
jgi:hypothetical protein